jgi:tripartite-type tricarboxylate transporter receptor subunit TctC
VAAAKSKPGSLSYGHTGQATGQHIAFEALKLRTNINVLQVPYRGAGPAMVAAIGGEVPITLAAAGGMVGHIKSGKLRPLAVTSGERLALLPDIPTVAEQGYPGFAIEEWFGIVGPAADMPPGSVQRLNTEINRALKEPAVTERLQGLGYFVDPMTPEQFHAYVASETRKVGAIIEAAKIKLE